MGNLCLKMFGGPPEGDGRMDSKVGSDESHLRSTTIAIYFLDLNAGEDARFLKQKNADYLHVHRGPAS